MHIKELKPKEKPGLPVKGELQFGSKEHLCEAPGCGRWSLLRWSGQRWVCDRCYNTPLLL